MRGILAAAPFDLVDLFFDLERFQVVELGFVRLELGVELVFAGFFLLAVSVRSTWGGCGGIVYRFVPLKQDDSSALVARRKVIARLVKLDGRDDVGCAGCQQLHAGINRLYSERGEREGGLVRKGYIPSVISSTSPLSPKHL
jgi:hypothetical protein